mgnify:CR=1 FL=1
MARFGSPLITIGSAAVVIAIACTVLVVVRGDNGSAEAPEQKPAVEYTAGQPAPEPNLPPPAPEPEMPVTNGSIESLVQGTLDAITRGDRAWLARSMESTSGRPLTEDDLLAAYRQFLWRSAQPMWARVRAGFEGGAWRTEDNGDKGRIILDVGGALGEMRLELVKIDNAWHYAGT